MAKWRSGRGRGARQVLDIAYLDRVAGHVGRAELNERLVDGLLELSDLLDRLEGLAEANDRDEVLTLARTLTGVSGHLGLSALAAASAEAIRMGRRPKLSTAGLARPLLAQRALALEALARHGTTLRDGGDRI